MIPERSDLEGDVRYEPPAVIYEGKLTTRAGTPGPSGFFDDPAGFDPGLLFGDD